MSFSLANLPGMSRTAFGSGMRGPGSKGSPRRLARSLAAPSSVGNGPESGLVAPEWATEGEERPASADLLRAGGIRPTAGGCVDPVIPEGSTRERGRGMAGWDCLPCRSEVDAHPDFEVSEIGSLTNCIAQPRFHLSEGRHHSGPQIFTKNPKGIGVRPA